MKVVPLLFFLLAASIQGGFAALDNDNPLTNPDLSPKARAHLESRILEWLCPRIKMTASNYLRIHLGPRIPQIKMTARNYIRTHLFELQSWLERLTPAQKQKLDNALTASIVAYLQTHPNDFMVTCYISNTTQNLGDNTFIYPFVDVYTINADVNDTASIQLSPNNSNSAYLAYFSDPGNTWSDNNSFVYKCLVKHTSATLSISYYWVISSVTYSHGGKQIVLTQKNPVYWSN